MKKPSVLALAAGVIVLLMALALPLRHMATEGGGVERAADSAAESSADSAAASAAASAADSAAARAAATATGLPRQVTLAGGVRRFTLRAADHDEARRSRLVGLSFLATLRWREDDRRQRFGPPAQALAQPGGSQALLVPALGLVATVATVATVANRQRGVLQHVAPADFAQWLQAPLRAAKPAVASAPPVKP